MLQNIEIRSFCTPPLPLLSLSLIKTVKEASAECRSFLDGVVIIFFKLPLHIEQITARQDEPFTSC